MRKRNPVLVVNKINNDDWNEMVYNFQILVAMMYNHLRLEREASASRASRIILDNATVAIRDEENQVRDIA